MYLCVGIYINICYVHRGWQEDVSTLFLEGGASAVTWLPLAVSRTFVLNTGVDVNTHVFAHVH